MLFSMRGLRRGLVVYQLLLILLGLALLIWLIVTLVNRNTAPTTLTPADSAVIDTAPIPVPAMPDTVTATDTPVP
jgi:hypothetical protein